MIEEHEQVMMTIDESIALRTTGTIFLGTDDDGNARVTNGWEIGSDLHVPGDRVSIPKLNGNVVQGTD